MKIFRVLLACSLSMPSFAAIHTLPVKTQQLIIEDGVRRYETLRLQSQFRVEVISDDEGLKTEGWKDGRPFIAARENERYAIRLHNPLPVRVAVNLTVDGLNTITGKPSGIEDGQKWLIEPYGFITIKGWQVNAAEARRFFFTTKSESYAQWRENTVRKDLSANCGVIGAAYFWSTKELRAYYDAHPVYRYSQQPQPYRGDSRGAVDVMSAEDKKSFDRSAPASAKLKESAAEEKAGTGMGERESFQTTSVAFDYDTGMKKLKQAVVIYYDFARLPEPNPFPALSYAPEAP